MLVNKGGIVLRKYCYVINDIVVTIENEFIDIFPDIPISKRYSKEFLDKCIVVDETVNVEVGMVYEDGVFKEPPIPEVIPEPEPTPEPVTPTEYEQLSTRIDTQDALLEDLIFNVIPTLTGGV